VEPDACVAAGAGVAALPHALRMRENAIIVDKNMKVDLCIFISYRIFETRLV
jgi:hypothetical protein